MAQRAKVDINVYQGDDRNYTFNVVDSAGAAVDYSSAGAVVLTVKTTIDDTSALFTSSATDSANGNNWASGIIVIAITDAQSALLTQDSVYDLEVTDSGGLVTTVCYGVVFVRRDIG